MFKPALFTIAKIQKQPKCLSTDEFIKKMWYIYAMEYYSALKKTENLPSATMQMDLEGIILSNKSDRERKILYGITYQWNLKYTTN